MEWYRECVSAIETAGLVDELSVVNFENGVNFSITVISPLKS